MAENTGLSAADVALLNNDRHSYAHKPYHA